MGFDRDKITSLVYILLFCCLLIILGLSIILIDKRNQIHILKAKIVSINNQNKKIEIYLRDVEPKIIDLLAINNIENKSASCCGMHQPNIKNELKITY